MATATAVAGNGTKTAAKTEGRQTILLKPIDVRQLLVTIEGISPLIQHQWSEKALRQIRDKQQDRKKTKTREARDPQAEGEAATYVTADGEFGVPVMAIKSALIAAAHKDLGIEKTLVRKAVFMRCEDPGGVLPMECSDPVIREDKVRVGMGTTDLRYRPEFREWRVTFTVDIDVELLQPADFLNLVNRAGFGVGIGEWRPEKNGDNGRFRVAAQEEK